MNKKLDRIEAHLQQLVENKLVQLLTGRRPSETLIERLMKAMQGNLKHRQDGLLLAPDQFIINVNPDDLLDWQNYQNILDEIAVNLQEKGETEGIHFTHTPSITVLGDPQTQKKEYSISVSFSLKNAPPQDTTAMPQFNAGNFEDKIPRDAYLIVRGTKNFPLRQIVVNIGRHSENDLILNDPHISRHHAQLRAINQHYILFDVGSTGGVFLNEEKITQATLQTGDVIRLGSAKLIYVQESVSADATTTILIDDEGAQ